MKKDVFIGKLIVFYTEGKCEQVEKGQEFRIGPYVGKRLFQTKNHIGMWQRNKLDVDTTVRN